MRFIVYGAGAIGASLGGLLFRAGYSVVLIARDRHLEALQTNGLVLSTPDSTEVHPIPAVAGPSEIAWSDQDVVLLTTKSQHTARALVGESGASGLVECAPPDTAVVSVQNGVANEATALRLFRRVYGVCVMFPATYTEPGMVQADCAPIPALLDIGCYRSGVDETAREIAGAFRLAGCESEPRRDIMAWKYTKLVMNLANAVDALCGPDRDDEDGVLRRELIDRARTEGREVLAAAGIETISDEEDRRRRGDLLQIRPVPGGVARQGSSTRQSLVRNTGSVEADYLNGEIALTGRLHGVSTPVNELLQRLMRSGAHAGKAPGSMTPGEIAQML